MLINWTEDKQKHYEFCYNTTLIAPKILRPIWALGVFIGVSFYKEIIHDLILGKGTLDINDVKANLAGIVDALKD